MWYLLTGWTVHDRFVVVQINLESTQISVVDAQHASIQLQLQHSFQLSDCVHLHVIASLSCDLHSSHAVCKTLLT